MDTAEMYWEVYDDQDDMNFQYVGYIDFEGKQVLDKIKDLSAQVNEIRRQYGKDIEIRVYRSEA